MTKVGIGLPGYSVADVRGAAETASRFGFETFSVYGDLHDLPPYGVLHAAADHLSGGEVRKIGPMGIPVGMMHPEVIAQHAIALAEQLPNQTYVGLVRGAFLEQIGEKPAPLQMLRETVNYVRAKTEEKGLAVPIYLGGFGPKLLAMAGEMNVQGVKLGGSVNPKVAEHAREIIGNPTVAITLGAVSVVDHDRDAARALAREEVGKYLDVVGRYDPTLDEDQLASLKAFETRFRNGDPRAHLSISDALLDNFSIAGTPDEVAGRIAAMGPMVDVVELGTPQGLHVRPDNIQFIGESVLAALN